MSVSVTNSGDQYSGNGDFALFFDKPDIDPGFVSAPISLTGDKGINGYISFSQARRHAQSCFHDSVYQWRQSPHRHQGCKDCVDCIAV